MAMLSPLPAWLDRLELTSWLGFLFPSYHHNKLFDESSFILSIVFMSSQMFQVDYCASKFACVGLDEALRVETLVHVIIIPLPPSLNKKILMILKSCTGRFRLHQDHRGLPCLHQHWHVWRRSGWHSNPPLWQKYYFSFLFQSKIIQILDPQFVADQVPGPSNQTTDQSINQQYNQPTRQPTNQPIDLPTYQVVDATLSNKAIIMLPWWTSYLIMLKVFFHTYVFVVWHGSVKVLLNLVSFATCFFAAFGSVASHDEAFHCIWIKLFHGSGHHPCNHNSCCHPYPRCHHHRQCFCHCTKHSQHKVSNHSLWPD